MPTLVKAINSSKLIVRVGDGASPEVFTQYCLINTSRGIDFTSSPTESLIPYCPPDEDLPGWVDREVDRLSASITGAGILDTASKGFFNDWFKSGLSRNLQVALNVPAVDGGGYWFGAGILTSFRVAGPGRREKATADLTIMSDGPWDWVSV